LAESPTEEEMLTASSDTNRSGVQTMRFRLSGLVFAPRQFASRHFPPAFMNSLKR
jgi:hypothetical protein